MESLIVAGAVSLAWCLAAIWLGPRLGFMDHPDGSELKPHAEAVTSLGGVGVFLGFHAAALVRDELSISVLVASAIVLGLGLVDDRVGLTPGVRLAVEVVAGGVLVWGLAPPTDGLTSSVLGLALVVFAINAVNLFDGLDGLAASTGLVTAAAVAFMASQRGVGSEMSLALAAALGGFVVVGWHPAKVFLGDAGAYVLGLLLAASMLDASPGGGWSLLVSSGLLGVFAVDLAVTLVRRRIGRRPLFEGDRSHLYDQLRDRGMSVPLVVIVAVVAQAVLVVVVLVADSLLAPVPAFIVLALVLVVVLGVLGRAGFVFAESS